jgi:hypothetical protein
MAKKKAASFFTSISTFLTKQARARNETKMKLKRLKVKGDKTRLNWSIREVKTVEIIVDTKKLSTVNITKSFMFLLRVKRSTKPGITKIEGKAMTVSV